MGDIAQTLLAALGVKPLPHPGQINGPFQQAITQYPILRGLGLQLQTSPPQGNNMLEYWPAGEPGDPSYPRPNSMKLDRPGIQIFDPKTRPIDVLGDVVSHQLVHTDPVVKRYYDDFKQSMTPQQHDMLKENYKYENDPRPFDQWAETSGIPTLFRGYLFQQWPDAQQYYTKSQIGNFDDLMKYLTGPSRQITDR